METRFFLFFEKSFKTRQTVAEQVMRPSFCVRVDEPPHWGRKSCFEMIMQYEILTRCVVVGKTESATEDLSEDAILGMLNENRRRFADIYAKVSNFASLAWGCHIVIPCFCRWRSWRRRQDACA